MSSVDVYTDIVLRTAQARGELRSFSDVLQTETRRWANTEVTIDTSFRPPDTAAVMRRIQELQGQTVEIPVRFVQQGQAPAPPVPSGVVNQAERFGSNTAANGGSSIAMQNGQPGAAPGGVAAGAIVAAVGPVAASLTAGGAGLAAATRDLRDEIADMARQFEAWATSGRGRGGGGGREPETGLEDVPQIAAGAPETYGISGDTYGLAQRRRGPEEQRTRAARARVQRDLRAARERRYWANDPNDTGNGFNNLGDGGDDDDAGGGGGRGRQGPQSAFRRFANTHPSLGRLLGPLGAAYATSAVMGATLDYNAVGYQQSGSMASLALRNVSGRHEALRHGIESTVPVIGGMLTNALDFGDAAMNWGGGKGFVTSETIRQRDIQQTENIGKATGAEHSAEIAAGKAATNDRRRLIELDAQARRYKLSDDLKGDASLWNADGTLTDNGKRLQAARHSESDAITARETRDDGLNNRRADDDSWLTTQTSDRHAKSDTMRAQHRYDRGAQQSDELADVDDRVRKQWVQAQRVINDPAADPREKKRVQDELAAAELAAVAEKQAKQHELSVRWAAEDRAIVAGTAAANAEAVGNSYDAIKIQAEAAAKSRIDAEQDVGKKTKIIAEEAAKAQARVGQLQLEAKRQDEQTNNLWMRVDGRGREADRRDIEDDIKARGEKDGLYDRSKDAWVDTEHGIDPLTNKPYDAGQKDKARALDSEKRARLAELDKGNRWATEDIDRDAARKEGHLRGDDFGAAGEDLKKRFEREFGEAQGNPERQAALKRQYDADRAQLDRDHGDEIRSHNVGRRQAELQMQGREQAARIVGEKADIAQQIRNAGGDTDLLQSIIAERKAQLDDEAMGSRHAEMFGSVADYANARFMSAANNDQGAYAELKEASSLLGKALDTPAKQLGEAAQKIVEKFNAL